MSSREGEKASALGYGVGKGQEEVSLTEPDYRKEE